MGITVKVTGQQSVQIRLRRIMNRRMEKVKDEVRSSGDDLHERTLRNTPIQSGHLKENVNKEIASDSLSATVYVDEADVEYAKWVERGTELQPGQWFMKQAYNEVEPIFKANIKNIVEK